MLLFSGLFISTMLISSFFAFQFIESAIIDHELDNMDDQKQSSMISISSSLGNLEITLFSIAITTIVITLLISFLISVRVSKPIINLSKGTQNIEDGLLKNELKIEGYDEIADLTNSINIMNHKLKEATKKALDNERLVSIGELASRLSHDMKNPLSTITSTLELIQMRNENLSDEHKSELEKIQRASDNLVHQINTVMDFIKTKQLEYGTYSETWA